MRMPPHGGNLASGITVDGQECKIDILGVSWLGMNNTISTSTYAIALMTRGIGTHELSQRYPTHEAAEQALAEGFDILPAALAEGTVTARFLASLKS
jgi:hypothetical protein